MEYTIRIIQEKNKIALIAEYQSYRERQVGSLVVEDMPVPEGDEAEQIHPDKAEPVDSAAS